MQRIYAAGLLLVTFFTLSLAGAQQNKQNRLSAADLAGLEGTWVLDVARSGLTPADAEKRVMKTGPSWVRLDIERSPAAPPIALIYNLDGSQNVNAFGPDTAVTRLSRDGDRVVFETEFTISSQAVTLRETVPLVPAGFDLTVDVVLRVEHGYQGVALPGPARGTQTAPNVSSGMKIFRKQL
jgi:hypothetical protein